MERKKIIIITHSFSEVTNMNSWRVKSALSNLVSLENVKGVLQHKCTLCSLMSFLAHIVISVVTGFVINSNYTGNNSSTLISLIEGDALAEDLFTSECFPLIVVPGNQTWASRVYTRVNARIFQANPQLQVWNNTGFFWQTKYFDSTKILI